MRPPFRKKAREVAFLTLYTWDMRGEELKQIFDEVVRERGLKSKRVLSYADALVKTVEEHLTEIDAKIEEKLKDWSLDRLGFVERNALRLGTGELLFLKPPDPGRVFIDVVDLVRKYADDKAARFVNGVLSAVFKDSSLTAQEEKEEVKQDGKQEREKQGGG
ncbi:MAG: transcription antitermination factor NusB [Aquificae bacterium]|nr:transcription antitermination factor NusB [Aquificota bacterium]